MAYIDEINKLKDYQKKQALAQLQQSKQQSLSQLDKEQQALNPLYYDKRNQLSTQNQLQAKNFNEYMANRGGTNAGTNAQANLMRNMALQNNLGALNAQQQAAINDINRRRSDVNTGFQNTLADRYNAIESNVAQQLAEYNRQQEALKQQQAYQELQAQKEYQRQLQLAQTRASNASSPKGNPTVNKESAMNYFKNLMVDASRGQLPTNLGYRFDKNDMLNWIDQNAADFINAGITIPEAKKYINDTYEWVRGQ